MARIRYCCTVIQGIVPCSVSGGKASSDGVGSCLDGPMEENCYNIVDDSSFGECPTCGSHIKLSKADQISFSSALIEPPLANDKLKKAFRNCIRTGRFKSSGGPNEASRPKSINKKSS